ncbi:MAG TPA: cupin domain-containing protein [Solirubrobacteraceae bacterium]|nr:cupin domain-containing protein [Solirubrobacteraceae bacterium]
MRRLNLSNASFTYDPDDPEGFRSGMDRVGPQLGAERTGASVYELPPRQALCPYHYEYGEEEWLLVLAGRPSVRDPEGTHPLEPGDLVFFARGARGAHQVRNDGDETARVLMWSDVVLPTATVYPDSDKVAIWTGNREDDVIVPRSSAVGYWHGERG